MSCTTFQIYIMFCTIFAIFILKWLPANVWLQGHVTSACIVKGIKGSRNKNFNFRNSIEFFSLVCFHVNSGIVFQSTNEKSWPNYEYQNNREQADANLSDLIQGITILMFPIFWWKANYLFSKTFVFIK